MPLFPGESDIDTLYHILKACGNNLTSKQKKNFKQNPLFYGVKLPKAEEIKPLSHLVPEMGEVEIDFLQKLLSINPNGREDAEIFLKHKYFDSIRNIIEIEIQDLIEIDHQEFELFKENKIISKDEIKIIEDTHEFREQERLNNSLKREKQENSEDLEYESSEEDDRFDYRDEEKMKISENDTEGNYEEQSQLIENFFSGEHKKSDPNIPIEIEEEISDSASEIKEKVSISPPSTQKKSYQLQNTSIDRELENIENQDISYLGGKTKDELLIKSLLSENKNPTKKIRFDEGKHTIKAKNHLEGTNILIQGKNNQFSNENPYSDTKIKTT